VSTVGVIVNPRAGKDIRRLVSAAGLTSDSQKVDVVRRVVVGATEFGATRIVLPDDSQGIARQAIARMDFPVEFLETPRTSTRDDTVRAAAALAEQGAVAVVAIGGDGTCRDVAAGWRDAPLIALSTGTNNVFPIDIDAGAAGTICGLLAARRLDVSQVAQKAKCLTVRIDDAGGDGGSEDEIALVEVALIESDFVGARAVHDPASIRAVIATIAQPDSTGLSSIAGRIRPIGRYEPGAVMVKLGGDATSVRASITPGRSDTLPVADVEFLAPNTTVVLDGPGAIALDGERYRTLSPSGQLHVTPTTDGPSMIDVAAAMHIAVSNEEFLETNQHTPYDLKGC
jgi:hypothetical protein